MDKYYPDGESNKEKYIKKVSELPQGSSVYFDIDGTFVDRNGKVIEEFQNTLDFIHIDHADFHVNAITNRPRSVGIPELPDGLFEIEVYREELDQSFMSPTSRYKLLEDLNPDKLRDLQETNPLLLHRFLNRRTTKIDFLYQKHGLRGLSEILILDDDIDGKIAEVFGFGIYAGDKEKKPNQNETQVLEEFDPNAAVSLLTQIPQYEVIRFFDSVTKIANHLEQMKPKQVVVPERSAVPIYWALSSLPNNHLETTRPITHLVPLGETIDPVSGDSFDDYSYPYIYSIFKHLGIDPGLPTTFILEVVTGNKAAYLIKFCEKYFQTGMANYILPVESQRKKIRRIGQGGYYSADVSKDKRYISSRDELGDRAIEVATPLIFDNKSALLNKILLAEFSDKHDDIESIIFGLPTIIQNEFAIQLLKLCEAKVLGILKPGSIEELYSKHKISENNRHRLNQWFESL